MAGKAEARLIYSNISTSEKVNELGVKGMLLYILLIAHADGQGRLSGSSKAIKAMVAPMLDELTEDDVEQALEAMGDKALICQYEDSNGRSLIQIYDWWLWQDKLRIKTASKYEPPPGWQDRVTPRNEQGRFKPE